MTSFSLFSHSMGALVTSDFMQNFVRQDCYPDKVFLSSPPVAGPGLLGVGFAAAPEFILKNLCKLPTLPLSGMLNLRRLSHDSRVYESYVKDEYNQLKIHSKLYFEILRTAREVYSRPLRIECPLFVSIGTEDGLVHPQYLIKFFTEVEKNAQLKIFEGGYHELHNEIEKYRKPYFDYLRQSLTGLAFE